MRTQRVAIRTQNTILKHDDETHSTLRSHKINVLNSDRGALNHFHNFAVTPANVYVVYMLHVYMLDEHIS